MSVPDLMIPAFAVAFTTLLVLVAFLATRPKQKKSTIRLAPEQRAAIGPPREPRRAKTNFGSYNSYALQTAPASPSSCQCDLPKCRSLLS